MFVVSGVMYKDCTSAGTPDGKNTQQEWCYIDPKEGGTPNWAYCAPILDYDKYILIIYRKSQDEGKGNTRGLHS